MDSGTPTVILWDTEIYNVSPHEKTGPAPKDNSLTLVNIWKPLVDRLSVDSGDLLPEETLRMRQWS